MLNRIRIRANGALPLLPVLAVASLVVAAPAALATAPAGQAPHDLTLKGNQDGTVFRSLTVEGENRVQIRFDRPELDLAVDPNQAPGLILEDALNILDRTLPDMVTPFLRASVVTPSPYLPRPWLSAYAAGPVARFTPAMSGVAAWKLQVVDSRGETAMVFAGQGNPPQEIAWDGQRLDKTPAAPGYTYSYVMEARDEAGNQRRFVGEGFGLPAYRRDAATGPEFLASGEQWRLARDPRSGQSALLLEAANWFNLRCAATREVRVVAVCRTQAAATELAAGVVADLQPLLGGAPGRLVTETRVESGAPEAGTLCLTARSDPAATGASR